MAAATLPGKAITGQGAPSSSGLEPANHHQPPQAGLDRSDIIAEFSLTVMRLFGGGFTPAGDKLSNNEALKWAVGQGLPELSQQLINEGADFDYVRGYRYSSAVIHEVAASNSYDAMRILLRSNATVSMLDHDD